MARKEGQLRGYEFGKDEEQAKWLAEGHGPGMCISIQQHMLRMVKKAVIQDQTEVQMESIDTVDTSTQTTPGIDETAMQMNKVPKSRCAALQTESPNNEPPHLTNDVGMSTELPNTCKMAVQANNEQPQP